MFSRTKIRFTRSWLYRKMADIRLSRIRSSAFKISSYAGPSVFCNGTTQARGVMILISKSAQITINNVSADEAGRFVALDITFGYKRITIANLYAPNLDPPGYYMRSFNRIEELGNDLKIIGGDFNCILNDELDKRGGLPHPHKLSANFIRSYMEVEDMIDTWRYYNPGTFRYMDEKESQSNNGTIRLFFSFGDFESFC